MGGYGADCLSGKSVRFHWHRAVCERSKIEQSRARGNEFRQPIQRDFGRPDTTPKIIRFCFSEIDVLFAPSRLMQRGVRVVTIRRVREAVDATASRVRRSQGGLRAVSVCFPRRTSGVVAYGKTVWFRHPLLVSSFAKARVPDRVQSLLPIREATEARRIRLRGERGISRQTIVQGRPGYPGATCGYSSCAFCAICAAQGAMGASRHPVFPAPSHVGRGTNDHAQLGRVAPRERGIVSVSPDGIFRRLPRPPLQARKNAGNKKRQRRTI